VIEATIRRAGQAVVLTWTPGGRLVVRGPAAAAALRDDVDAWFTPGHTVWYNPRMGGTYAGFDSRHALQVADGLEALTRNGFAVEVTRNDTTPTGDAPRWLTRDGKDWRDEGTVLAAPGPAWARRDEYRDPATGRMVRPGSRPLGKATPSRSAALAVALIKVMGQQLGLFGGGHVVHVKQHVARNKRTGAVHVVHAHDQHRAAAAEHPEPVAPPPPAAPPAPPPRRAHPGELGPDADFEAVARDLMLGGDVEGIHRHYSGEILHAHELLAEWDRDFAFDRIHAPTMKARLDALEARLLPPLPEPPGTMIGGVRVLGTADTVRLGARDLLAASLRWRRELFDQPRRDAKDIMRRHSKGLHVTGYGSDRTFSGGRERFRVYDPWAYKHAHLSAHTEQAMLASMAAQLRDLTELPESHQHAFRESQVTTRVLGQTHALEGDGINTAAVATFDENRRPQVRMYFGAFVGWADANTAERGASLIHELGHILDYTLSPPPLDGELLAMLGPETTERARARPWGEDDDHRHRTWTQSSDEWLAEAYRVAYADNQMEMKTTLRRSDLDLPRFRAMIEARIAAKHGATPALHKAAPMPTLSRDALAVLLKAFAQQIGLFAPRAAPQPVAPPSHPDGPGWSPIPGSHRGGYHRLNAAGKFDYWYPDTGATTHPHASDAHLVPAEPSPAPAGRPAPKHILQYLHRAMAGATAHSMQGLLGTMRQRLLKAEGTDGGLDAAGGRHAAEVAVDAILEIGRNHAETKAAARLDAMNAHELVELVSRLGAHAATKQEAVRQIVALYDAPSGAERHPDDIYPRQVGPVKRGMALDEVEAAIGALDEEHLVVFAPDGRQIARLGPESTRAWSDTPPGNTCYVPPSVIASGGRAQGVTITHNHPSGGPPSVEDLIMAAAMEARQIRAVARGRGGAWVMDRPANGWEVGAPRLRVLHDIATHKATTRMNGHIRASGGEPTDGANAKGYSDALWSQLQAEEWLHAFTTPAAAALGLRFERRGPDPGGRKPEHAVPAAPVAVATPQAVAPAPAPAGPADGWHDWTPELDAKAEAQKLSVDQRLGPSSWLVQHDRGSGYRESWGVLHADGRVEGADKSRDAIARAGRGHRREHGTRQPIKSPELRPHLKAAGVQLAPRNSMDGPGLSLRQVDKHRVAVMLPHGWHWDARADEAVKQAGERNLEHAAATLEAQGYRITMGAAASGFHADRLVPVPTGPRTALGDPKREMLAEVLKREPSEDEHRGYRVGWADVRADRPRDVRDTPGFGRGYHTGRALAQNALGGTPEAIRLLQRHDPMTLAALRAHQVGAAAKSARLVRGLVALLVAARHRRAETTQR